MGEPSRACVESISLRTANPTVETGVVQFRASCIRGVAFWDWRCCMGTLKETPIERIYRKVTGYKMPQSVRRILLRKPTSKRKAH
jgi:hypothetical protein